MQNQKLNSGKMQAEGWRKDQQEAVRGSSAAAMAEAGAGGFRVGAESATDYAVILKDRERHRHFFPRCEFQKNQPCVSERASPRLVDSIGGAGWSGGLWAFCCGGFLVFDESDVRKKPICGRPGTGKAKI